MIQEKPVLGLSEQDIHYFRKEFRLSYHLNYLDVCQNIINLKGLDILEVGGALPASLVIDQLGCNSWTAVETPAYDQELQNANQFHRNSQDIKNQRKHASKYKHIYDDIEEISNEHFGKYDLIFSIACFEHIHRLPQALKVMNNCLKPGGHIFTMHSPIWSAYDGHHLPIKRPERFGKAEDERFSIFQPWEHLLLTRYQAYEVLTKRFDKEFAEEIIYYTYNSDHINRYFSEDYKLAFSSSPLMVKMYEKTFPTLPTEKIQSALESKYCGYKEFSNNGILALLKKNDE